MMNVAFKKKICLFIIDLSTNTFSLKCKIHHYSGDKIHSIYFINTTFFGPEPGKEIEIATNKSTTLCLKNTRISG